MKLEPILEYCECGCKCVVPHCRVCQEDKNCRVRIELSNPERQKFCETCGTEFDWSNLIKTNNYPNDWRHIN